MLASTFFGKFQIAWPTFAAPTAAGIVLAAGAWFYDRWRKDLKAAALAGTAQVALFTAVGAALSYIAASANLPLADHVFADIDRALGLDWHGMLTSMNAQFELHLAFMLAYTSFKLQAITTILVLAFAGYLLQLRIFTLAFVLSALVCIAISALLPALGAWDYFQLAQSDYAAITPATRELHLPILHGLRDGTLRTLAGITAEGIITFPSFHTALAVIFMVALWPVPVLRWVGIVLNGLMIASTPIDGGHYFIDVLAGVAIAAVCVAAARAYTFGAPQMVQRDNVAGAGPAHLAAGD